MELRPDWEYVADTVMGGVSSGQITRGDVEGRDAVHLTGTVSLENNGGFIQMAFDLAHGDIFDASGWLGVEVDLRGFGSGYELRLRTDQLTRPWQSYRAVIEPSQEWQIVRLPWSTFEAHRTDAAFDPARLRRLGILAIGAEMEADIAVSGIRFYK
nr:CIA30 family protein [uncultured Sulfitobacter sp.]